MSEINRSINPKLGAIFNGTKNKTSHFHFVKIVGELEKFGKP